jgi:hypothetical protein
MTRHYGMDWLRIGAFGLLILYHIGMVFVPWDFHVKTAHPIDGVAVPMQAVNAWRLSLLFVVSGYASRAIFLRDPRPGAFAWRRTLRLAIPMLAAIVLVVPPQPWIELSVKHGYSHGFLHFWLNDYFRFGTLAGLVLPTWQHLWFVAYLWVYTAVLAGVLALVPQRAQTAMDRGLAAAILVDLSGCARNACTDRRLADPPRLFRDVPVRLPPAPQRCGMGCDPPMVVAGSNIGRDRLCGRGRHRICLSRGRAPFAGCLGDIRIGSRRAMLGGNRRAAGHCRSLVEPGPSLAVHAERRDIPLLYRPPDDHRGGDGRIAGAGAAAGC